MVIDPKRLYTVREAADLLSVTPDTVRSYCRDEKCRGQQVGPKKQWMILGSEIKRMLKEWNMDEA